MALRSYEDVKVAWERSCDLLEMGLDVRRASEGLRAAVAMFDEWLDGAAGVGAFVESVTLRTGRKVADWDAFREAAEKVRGVRQSVIDSIERISAPAPEVPLEAIAEARGLYEQGKSRDLGDALARRLARKT